MSLLPADLATCLRVLQAIADDHAQINAHESLKTLIAKINRDGRKRERRLARDANVRHDRDLIAATGLVAPRQTQPALPAPEGTDLAIARTCYVCKQPFTRLHGFYHQLCPSCADLNYAKRFQRADLSGRVALVTGGRIKIGYQMALRLLRDGAQVLVTTRFAHDAARRFSAEADAAQWIDRLTIHHLELRDIAAVEAFARHVLASLPAIDILINNAAQTIKRPLEFYRDLIRGEQAGAELPATAQRVLASARPMTFLEQQPDYPRDPALAPYFPAGLLDLDGQQIDLRPATSWVLKLDEVSTLELLEVQLVNVVAPFLLVSQLKPLLCRSRFARRFVVNVSAMEGQFNRGTKTVYHPHTNMAKAALNMLTRTSANDYAKDGIWMNSIDTGWITDEKPFERKARHQASQGFYAPLDEIDGMARIYDPIVRGILEPDEPWYGYFLKDFVPHPW
jgi:NAD(P)-dependent dehydrogenase (short-subunit alcohol dehydrogenase family)